MGIKIRYNAPVLLTFCICCLIVFLFDLCVDNSFIENFCTLLITDGFHPQNFAQFLTLFTYIFGHTTIRHLSGNLIVLLVVGPAIEELYGSLLTALMIIFTALVTGVYTSMVSSYSIVGASGIAFMILIATACADSHGKGIPITLIFAVCIYIGSAYSDAMQLTGVSHSAHLIGAICGGSFSVLRRILLEDNSKERSSVVCSGSDDALR